MALIFGGSSDSKSFPRSSRILAPVLHWLFPNMADETVKDIVVLARKCAHLTEYAVLAMLVWRALRRPASPDPRPWRWRVAGLALLVAALYAASDEYHQTKVPGRNGCVSDVLIDSCGSAAGLLAVWQIGRWRRRW
jgi:VanZ family protein